MVPTLQATLGVKGHRPVVGTRDCKDVLYVFAVMNLISGVIHANTLESLQAANRKSTESKTRRMQRAFADHLRHVGRMYPGDRHQRVVLLIDNAPWHRGKPIDEAMADMLDIEVRVEHMGQSSIRYAFTVFRGDEALARARFTVVLCRLLPGHGLEKIAIPDPLRAQILSRTPPAV
ncbi:MAG: hypothetical protein U0736_15670 [Gemmataceae bacterium]